CYFDRPKLESMLSNLISNAFKFTGEGGKVKVTEEKRGTNTIFTITDTGIGMSPQQVEHLFDRFSQTTVSELQHGSGIGLALARELAILHGGDISVQSEEGRGSVFTLTVRTDKDFFKADEITNEAIPIMTEPPNNHLPAELSKSEMVTPTSMHEALNSTDMPVVLVVEDNPDVRVYISDIISGTYKVVTAEHGKIGLEKALDQLPDLIITDIMMPEMDGTQLCRHLKENEKTSHIPVVMLTARADQADRLEGLNTGADDYLIKPFQAQELLARVKNLIEQRRKLQAYYRKTISGFAMPPGEEQSLEAKFLGKVRASVEDNLDDENFSVVELGKIVGMSRSQLHRKLTALTGFSPNEVIRNMRLEYARSLLKANSGTVSEIAYRSGFSSPAYFVKCFREYFGQTPGEIS
ncbi:MAG TPA: response regulator, partial [Saprospiraceae bacterium]|nr:response regulator [Saprospiraceae bacterium]